MATAADCFKENIGLIGSPVNATAEKMIQWNLNNGLRMLAEEVQQLRQEQHQIQQALRQVLNRLP